MVFSSSSSSSGISNACSFLIHVVRGRWFTLFATLLIMSSSGASYIFGIYSKDIKSSLSYNQQTLNTIGFFKDLGTNLGIVAGLLNEVTPPWVVLTIGSGLNLFGYLMIYLAIAGKITRPAVWKVCLYMFLGANSQTFINTGALVSCVVNFPLSRGVVLGLLKGFFGLSGAIYMQMYLSIYGDHRDSKSLVLLIAWLPAAVAMVFVRTIRVMDAAREKINTKPFFCFLYISIALATYLMVMIIVESKVTFSHPEHVASTAAIIFLLFLPLAVVMREEIRIRSLKKESTPDDSPPVSITVDEIKPSASIEPPPPTEKPSASVLSCISRTFRTPIKGEDYSIPQALASIEMITLFTATICGVGGALTAIDNMGQIGQSLGYPTRSISTFVSLISIWNYAGRVASGYLSETLLSKYKFPRPLLFTVVLVFSCIGHLLIAFGVPNSLYFSSIIIGFCFGAQQPLIFAIISEIFGLKHYSTMYNVGAFASPIGSYVMNVRVAGHLYDREAAKQNGGLKESTCMGAECFKLSFLIITAVTVFGVLVSLVLVWRSWDFYRGDVYAKFRVEGEENGVAMERIRDGEDEDGAGLSEKTKNSCEVPVVIKTSLGVGIFSWLPSVLRRCASGPYI